MTVPDTGVRGLALLTHGLLAGSALANHLLETTPGPSTTYAVQYKQVVLRAYGVVLPVLGAGAALTDAALLGLTRRSGRPRWLAGGATLSVLAGLATTVTVHLPLNERIRTWDPEAPPPDATAQLGRWRTANTARTAAALAGFLLVLADAEHHRPDTARRPS